MKKYNIYIYKKHKNTITNRFYRMDYYTARNWITYCEENGLKYTLTHSN